MPNHSSIPQRYYNVKLTFRVPTRELETDTNGNVYPKYEVLDALAILKPRTKDQEANAATQPGQSVSEVDVVGYMGSPTRLPIQPPLEVDCEINGKKGKLKIDANLRSPYETAIQERHCGQKIVGKFIIQG